MKNQSQDIKILFLGLDGSGKSTMIAKLSEYKVNTDIKFRMKK